MLDLAGDENMLNEDFAINSYKNDIIAGIRGLVNVLEGDGRKADARKIDKLAITVKAIK